VQHRRKASTHAGPRPAHAKRSTVQRAGTPKRVVVTQKPTKTKRKPSAYNAPKASLPAGILSTESLLPTAKKVPFLALALVGLAILLLALGALPAGIVPNPAFAEALVERRDVIALGGLATLLAAIAAYILV
jgi:hypothetical protein